MRARWEYDVSASTAHVDSFSHLRRRVPDIAVRGHPEKEVVSTCCLASHTFFDGAVFFLEVHETLYRFLPIQIEHPDPGRVTRGHSQPPAGVTLEPARRQSLLG